MLDRKLHGLCAYFSSQMFQLDVYGPDGEGTVRSSKVIARSQDFTNIGSRPSPLSPSDSFSQPSSEPFSRTSQGRSGMRGKVSPGTAHRRTSSSKSGMTTSGSSSSVNELLHLLQQQKPKTPSRTSSQSSLNLDGDHTPPWLQKCEQATSSLQASLQTSAPSPVTHRSRPAFVNQRSTSCDSSSIRGHVSTDSLERMRPPAKSDVASFSKIDSPYTPYGASAGQLGRHHERSASLSSNQMPFMGRMDHPSGSLTNLSGSESVGRRPRSGSTEEGRFQQYSSINGAHSTTIPHYLKGPQRSTYDVERVSDDSYHDKSLSMEELRTKAKSSSLPKNAQLPRSSVDRASTEDESDRLQPVAVSHSASAEHLPGNMPLMPLSKRSSSGSLQYAASAADDLREQFGNPVTTIMATHAVRARREVRRRGERRFAETSSGDSQPAFLRSTPRAVSSHGFGQDDLQSTEITATRGSYSVGARPPGFESQPNFRTRSVSVKSNSLPRDSSPTLPPKLVPKKRSGLPVLVNRIMMPSPRSAKKNFLRPMPNYDESDDELNAANLDKKVAGDRMSLSAPSSPTQQKKSMALDGNKSDYAEDEEDISERSVPSKAFSQ